MHTGVEILMPAEFFYLRFFKNNSSWEGRQDLKWMNNETQLI